ncbi:GAS2 domain-containing protein [Histoplasma capsulatum var. duboisii H88]|uniref:GAS2 domain-containing protein n=1 Tax=Ajellomyces capsulatus (strain H88) TaxID=544711 RepID=F0UV88_AJEC8|nr:GAS2 domain-containing protein [Histoplasma capsulatum var. duboisii H88]QSS50972.1 GAS2 domain-containing protein [Histoplasma capsulatum var. duboisii H88]
MADDPFSLTPALRLRPSSNIGTPSRSSPRSPTPCSSRSPDPNTTLLVCTLDPLLANLSPESTLAALAATDAMRTNGKTAEGILAKAIAEASRDERALAVRAAVAGQNLKQWHAEVLAWEWPRKQDAVAGKGFIPPNNGRVYIGDGDDDDGWEKYLGCLPAAIVEQHEERIDAIRAGMKALDVEELKEHVLNAHIPSRSRPSSSNSSWSTNTNTLSYVQLSDFTAVITATILQALPYLSKLNILLNIWDVRITVLHQVPELLVGLGNTKRDIYGALDRLKIGLLPELDNPLFSKASFGSARHRLESKVLIVGSKMDRILDSLEGQEDVLPDIWIDEMETIETVFATWAFEAGKMASENDFKRSIPPLPECSMQSSETEMPEKASLGNPTTQSSTSLLGNDRKDKDDNSVEVMDDRSIHIELELPTTPFQTDPAPNDEISPELMDVQRTPPPSSPLIPQVQRPGKDISQAGTQSTHTAVSSETELTQESLNPTHSDSDTSSALPSTPTTSTTREELTSLSCPDAAEPLMNQQSIDELPDQAAQLVEDHASDKTPGTGNSDKPSSVLIETPENSPEPPDNPAEQSLAEETIGTNQSFPRSPLPSQNADPASPQSPEPKASSGQRSPFNTTDLLISSSPTTAELGPYKATKNKPEALKLETILQRRDSIVSSASTPGSGLSYVSDPEIKDAQVATAHGSPVVVESPGGFLTTASKAPWALGPDGNMLSRTKSAESYSGAATSSRPPVQRTMSLPLERFVDGDPQAVHEMDDPNESNNKPEVRQASSASIEVSPKTELLSIAVSNTLSMGPTNGPKPAPNLRRSVSSLALSSINRISNISRGLHPNYPRGLRLSTSSDSLPSTAEEQSPSVHISDSKDNIIPSPDTPTPRPILPRRSSKRFSRLLSPVTSISSHKERNTLPTTHGATLSKNVAANSVISPSFNAPKSPEDQLEEKINSILTTIPTRIHLVSTPDRSNGIKTTKKAPRASEPSYSTPRNDRLGSQSPMSSRSTTPTPSLTLTPAFGRSRRPHTHHDDESAVRLYHLHRGGKAAPLKLFVRSVGEDGERVMVRVGGGWADLGEYLREYAVHHGRRNVSDAKFEVRGLPNNNNNTSPNYTQNKHAPVPNTGRSTPVSRPGSAFDIRPSSSLNIRKTRRSMANPAELPNLTTANIEKASGGSSDPSSNGSGGPLSFFSSSRRRLSTSSNASMSVASTYGGEGQQYASTPLGLAGPHPKSRQVSISPESEAWVENVVGRARRTSATLRPERSYGNLRRFRPNALQEDALRDRTEGRGYRSVSDVGGGGGAGNKRVYLRGLDRGRVE